MKATSKPLGPPWQPLLGEGVGTLILAFAVVGSGAHAANLTDTTALALLINALATAAVLGVLIFVLLPVSGAHFNPAVTVSLLLRTKVSPGRALGFVVVQTVGAIAGTILATLLFSGTGVVISETARANTSTVIGEVIATAGLVAIIVSSVQRGRLEHLPVVVSSWIGAGYFVTPSTGFANPAITIGRIFTDGFTGIDPPSAAWFVSAQVVGALLGLGIAHLLRPLPGESER